MKYVSLKEASKKRDSSFGHTAGNLLSIREMSPNLRVPSTLEVSQVDLDDLFKEKIISTSTRPMSASKVTTVQAEQETTVKIIEPFRRLTERHSQTELDRIQKRKTS